MLYKMKDGDNRMFCHELSARVENQTAELNSQTGFHGALGSGKSTAAISTGIGTAKILAEDYEGDKDEWIKYFNPETNWGIMSLDNILKCYDNMTKNQYRMNVWLIDDFSPSMGSRSYMQKSNRDQTDLLVISRPNLATILYSFPNKALVDINIRRLLNYECEMQKSYYQYKYNSMKVFKIEQKADDPKPYRKYLQDGHGHKFLLHFTKFPEDLVNGVPVMEIYKQKRMEAQKEMEKQIIDRLKKIEDNTGEALNVSKTKLYQDIYDSWMGGAFGNQSLIEVCNERDINYNALKNANIGRKWRS